MISNVELTACVGYAMAKNLRAKIPAEDTLFVQDINAATSQKFLQDNAHGVRVAANVREVAEKAVRTSLCYTSPFNDEHSFPKPMI